MHTSGVIQKAYAYILPLVLFGLYDIIINRLFDHQIDFKRKEHNYEETIHKTSFA